MKSSLRKLRGFTLPKSGDLRVKRDQRVPARQDELLQASQDMLDMRNCYDSLLSAAAATANSAYEFSEALREMGTCLLEKTSLNDDEESGKVLLMLGKVQFALQNLVDNYRVHIIQTITTPSESLIKELHTVEEMKRQCDDKRDLYKFMLAAQREKGRSRPANSESFSSQQLRAAREDYEEEANLFVFRLKSLKQGQSRSLLTQAARHHAAQLNFFRKGVNSLENVDPHVKVVAEQQHIDYHFIGPEDDETQDDEENDGYYGNDDGELSFDYSLSQNVQDVTSASTKPVEEALDKSHVEFHYIERGVMPESPSALILPEKKFESSEKIKQIHASSPRKFHTYVLPTPVDAKNSTFTGFQNSFSAARTDSKDGFPVQLWHSSPLEPNKPAKYLKDELSSPTRLPISHSMIKESNKNTSPSKLPPPLGEGFSISMLNSLTSYSDGKKYKRQAFSGPIMGKSWSNNPSLSINESVMSVEYPSKPSVAPGRLFASQLSASPRVSPSASPLLLSPKNNELHELPRPPIMTTKPASLIGHSGPLFPKSKGLYITGRIPSHTASPLPTPPVVIARSFSIPSNGQRSEALEVSNFLEASRNGDTNVQLTLISLANTQPSART